MKVKKSKFIKFFVVCLVCVFGFFGVSCVVNADSINDTPDYQYLKTSYYNWDNITWYTDENTFVTGSNDTFSTENEFVDYYSINIPNNEMYFNVFLPGVETYTFVLPEENISFRQLLLNYGVPGWTGYTFYYDVENIAYLYCNDTYLSGSTSNGLLFDRGINQGGLSFESANLNTLIINNVTFNLIPGGGGANDSGETEEPSAGDDYWRPTDGPSAYSLNSRAIDSSDYTFLIERNNIYNDSLSTIDLFVYDSVLNTDLIFNSIVFEKSNFFMKVGDLNNLSVPMISASVLSGGYDITFEINGFVRDINGDVRDLSIVTDSRIDVLGYQTLYPTFQELFGNVESINNDSLMYINNIRVLIEFPNNYVDNLSYRYSVSSIESNNIKYGGAFNSWVNSSINTNLGSSLVDNINTFLQIEILPGLSFFGILLLAVAVPMLIWILKIFFGG